MHQFFCLLLSGLMLLTAVPAAAAPRSSADVLVQRSRIGKGQRDADPVVNNLQRRTFRYFWETANQDNGMVPDRYPSPSFASIAAIGFGLTAYVIGAERSYISRNQARRRVLTTLRSMAGLPQGPQEVGAAGHKGFYYHFLDMEDGLRFETTELSTVDTSLLLGSVRSSTRCFPARARSMEAPQPTPSARSFTRIRRKSAGATRTFLRP